MTAAQFYSLFLEELISIYDRRETENITAWVLENTTGLKKWEIRKSEIELDNSITLKLRKYLDELLQYKPVQYVLHESWFYKMKFFVDENVLIPRPETEELVSLIVNDTKTKSLASADNEFKIIDIGTGSGCIAISLRKELPGADITAIDISEQALFVAKKNAEDLKTTVDFFHIHFLNENEWQNLPKYDVIVSNPPYIPRMELSTMGKNVTAFEPSIALFVPDNDPLIFYKAICKFAHLHLNIGGRIYLEVHENYAGEVSNIFTENNFKSEIIKDIYGKERMIRAIGN
ncbi:MAG: peptide chain release factor N(5)-glutamine methyltransferase [Ginsengibacter sp.]